MTASVAPCFCAAGHRCRAGQVWCAHNPRGSSCSSSSSGACERLRWQRPGVGPGAPAEWSRKTIKKQPATQFFAMVALGR